MIDYKNNGFQNRGGDLDITNKCTLQCPTCARGNFKYKSNDIPGGDLTIEEWEDLTDYFSSLTLNGTYGDPVFNPNFIQMLYIAHAKDVHVSISNAASQKSMDWYEEAFKAHPKAEWRFGIDGLPYQSFAHRINQDGEHLYEVMKTASKMGMKCIWQYIVFKYNEDKIDEAIQMSKDIGVDLEINYSARYTEFLKPTNTFDVEEDQEEFRPKCLTQTNDLYMTQERLPFVATNKQVLPCCWVDAHVQYKDNIDKRFEPLLDESNNLNTNKIKDIVNSKSWINFFDRITKGDAPELCKKKCSTRRLSLNRQRKYYVNGKLSRES